MRKKEFNAQQHIIKQIGGMAIITFAFLLAMAFLKILEWSGLLGSYFLYTS